MFDVVIIGSGAAGLTTALNTSSNLNILILSADLNSGSNTKLAQGGIAASWKSSNEQIDSHIEDTMKAGCYANDHKAVKLLVTESDKAIDFLIGCGIQFDRKDDNYDLTCEGAHSIRRIFHANGDGSGAAIYERLLDQVRSRDNITVLNNCIVSSVLELSTQTYQVDFNQEQRASKIITNNLVIASGGYANLFTKSSNAKHVNGTSLLLAKQLDLEVDCLQYMQFHPTGYLDSKGKYHLITESLRGEGARLFTHESGYFMKQYSPLLDVAPRDITSRAVVDQQQKGHTVYLDCRYACLEQDIYKRFSTVNKVVAADGYDLRTDLIPVEPVAHYSIGGIVTNLNAQTSKPGVYAVGEAALTGVHGANRLASNSLLECIVFGLRAGEMLQAQNRFELQRVTGSHYTNIYEVYDFAQRQITACCGIIRNDTDLKKYLSILEIYEEDHPTAKDVISIAKDIVKSCIENDSIGCHYKEKNE